MVAADLDQRKYLWLLKMECFLCLGYVQELAGIIKLSSYNSFSLFECRKAVTGSKAIDTVMGKVPFRALCLCTSLFRHLGLLLPSSLF
jgi:hypothetical protein